MTDYREQAIREVAAALGFHGRYIREMMEHTAYRVYAYAVAQRERVLELEAFLRRVKGAGGGAMSFEHDDEDIVTILGREAGELLPAQLQQKEGERNVE